MSGLKRLFTNRITYISLAVVALMTVLVVRLYNLQVVHGESYRSDAESFRIYELPIDAPRGNIYDRNGVLLAGNRKAYKLYMINTDDPQEYRDRMYLDLISLMEANGDFYHNFLSDYLMFPPAWGTKIDEDAEKEEKKAWVNSIISKRSDREYFDSPVNAFNFLREQIFDISDEYSDYEAYRIMILRYSTYMYGLDSIKPGLFGWDVCEKTVQEITARSQDFHGVTSEETYYRSYVNNLSLGCIVGYVRAIDEDEFEALKDQGYYADDVIGKLGIEKVYESVLRGTRGYRKYYKTISGEVQEIGYQAPSAGNDIYLNIDINVQTALYNSLEENVRLTASRRNDIDNFGDCHSGAAVCSNVNTGEIVAMVSYPGFDNNIFVDHSPEAQKKIDDLFNDPHYASLNRCTQCTYPIGSMIKPAIAVCGLESGVTDSKREIDCPMYIDVAGRRMKCLSFHGPVNLTLALGRSCNVYFATIGIEAGIDNVDKWIKAFGLGEPTGVEIEEKIGHRSNPETMDIFAAGTYHKWSDASTAATCIGQLYTTFTPLQVNRYVSCIANGGTLHEMHLVNCITDPKGTVLTRTEDVSHSVGASQEHIDLVRDAMTRMVDNYKDLTSLLSDYPKYFLAGKTGTAQTGTNTDSSHAFYMGYAPYNDPQISLTLMLEHGVYSGNNFPVVKSVIDTYFGGAYDEGYNGFDAYLDSYNHTGDGSMRLGRWFQG